MTLRITKDIRSVNNVPLLTVGYWLFSGPDNTGELCIDVKPMSDLRFLLAVIGHEWLEARWCKLRGITGEQCDAFDEQCEKEFAAGTRDRAKEPGFDRAAPYRVGHILGCTWEYICIYGTFASWDKYEKECAALLGLPGDPAG